MRTSTLALTGLLCASTPAAAWAHADEWPHAGEHGHAATSDAHDGDAADPAHAHGAVSLPGALRAGAGAAAIALAFAGLAAWHRRRRRE